MARRYHCKTALSGSSAGEVSLPNLNQAMTKGACPLCSVLREFQSIAVERINPSSCGPLCNFHCWSVANAAPAMVALSVYSNMLLQRNQERSMSCTICAAIQIEEEKRITEFTAELEKARFVEWMNQFGTLCIIHAARLERCVPNRLRTTIRGIIDRNMVEVQQQLRDYAEAIEAGDHSGGGVLGKTAAFLVGFRGFSS
jgi:hypothetical protein